MNTRDVQILDTTLRDGSYVIDFQFTADDTALLVSTLDFAGIPWIEIAHGLGLGAARAGNGEQAATDEAYLKAAAASVSNAKFGAFFIPGIGTADDLRLAADCGAHFIRVGTNVNEVDQAVSFIELAKSLGLITFSNLMKSYAVPPEEFAQHAKQAEDAGADYVCIVDSAGGMLPEDVKAYMESAQSACNGPICFHGHNNLSMAVANSLQAIESGAAIVDTSLQGMGRSEGNTMTEILVSILQKRGVCEDVDVNSLLDISNALIRPLLHHAGYSPLGVTYGRAKFHSSFLARILETSRQYGIDPRELIFKVTERDQVNAPQELVDAMAQELASSPTRRSLRFSLAPQASETTPDLIAEAVARATELKEHACKRDLPSVMNIVVSPHEPSHVSPYVESNYGCAISNVMLENSTRLGEVIEAVAEYVDFILLDPGGSNDAFSVESRKKVFVYSDEQMWARALCTQLTCLLDGSLVGREITVLTSDVLVEGTRLILENAGATVSTRVDSIGENTDALIGYMPRKHAITPKMISALADHAIILDAGIGSISREALDVAEARGLQVVRIDLRPALAHTALEAIQMRATVEERMGRDVWDGVTVVAGGFIGRDGDVIVDHILQPTRIIGIADGNGGVRGIDDTLESVQRVRNAITAKRLGIRNH